MTNIRITDIPLPLSNEECAPIHSTSYSCLPGVYYFLVSCVSVDGVTSAYIGSRTLVEVLTYRLYLEQTTGVVLTSEEEAAANWTW